MLIDVDRLACERGSSPANVREIVHWAGKRELVPKHLRPRLRGIVGDGLAGIAIAGERVSRRIERSGKLAEVRRCYFKTRAEDDRIQAVEPRPPYSRVKAIARILGSFGS